MLTDDIIAEIWERFSVIHQNTAQIGRVMFLEEAMVARVVAACMERQYREADSRKEAV